MASKLPTCDDFSWICGWTETHEVRRAVTEIVSDIFIN